MKPAGLDEGPVVPRAEEAIITGHPEHVIGFIPDAARDDLTRRFDDVNRMKHYDVNDVAAGGVYVAAFINFIAYAHYLYERIAGGGREEDFHRPTEEGSRYHY